MGGGPGPSASLSLSPGRRSFGIFASSLENRKARFMRVLRRVRLPLHADAIKAAVAAASSQGRPLDVGSEANRIAKATGLSATMAARDLVKAGIAAQVAMNHLRGTQRSFVKWCRRAAYPSQHQPIGRPVRGLRTCCRQMPFLPMRLQRI